MRLPILVLLLLAAAHPARAAAQRASSDDTIPASAVVVDEDDVAELPRLLNRRVIERLLSQNYPPALRETGRTGRVQVTMVIDPTGVPHLVTVTGSSGIPEFDDGAVRVTRGMRFSRPTLNGSPVWVRVRVPVTFDLQQ